MKSSFSARPVGNSNRIKTGGKAGGQHFFSTKLPNLLQGPFSLVGKKNSRCILSHKVAQPGIHTQPEQACAGKEGCSWAAGRQSRS